MPGFLYSNTPDDCNFVDLHIISCAAHAAIILLSVLSVWHAVPFRGVLYGWCVLFRTVGRLGGAAVCSVPTGRRRVLARFAVPIDSIYLLSCIDDIHVRHCLSFYPSVYSCLSMQLSKEATLASLAMYNLVWLA